MPRNWTITNPRVVASARCWIERCAAPVSVASLFTSTARRGGARDAENAWSVFHCDEHAP